MKTKIKKLVLKIIFIIAYKILRSISYIILLLIEKINTVEEKYIGKKFDTKYDKIDIMLLAMQLPQWLKLNLPSIWNIYPFLSKRKIYEIIDFRKNSYTKYREILKNIS